jgi:hypothetical protein
MSDKLMLIIVSLALMASSGYGIWKDEVHKDEVIKLQEQTKSQSNKTESLETRISGFKNVMAIDERIMYRYQGSVSACRDATSALIDGDYSTAMLYAKDVGETEEDLQPLLDERKSLLQGTNAEML